jgi:hypothetical protein
MYGCSTTAVCLLCSLLIHFILALRATAAAALTLLATPPKQTLNVCEETPDARTKTCACAASERLVLLLQDRAAFHKRLESFKNDLLGDRAEGSFWWFAGVSKKGLVHSTSGARRGLNLPCVHGTIQTILVSVPRLFAASHLRSDEYWKIAGMYFEGL